jgi:hypothetical protein
LGNRREARLHYERALRLNPDNQLARENLQLLNAEPAPKK